MRRNCLPCFGFSEASISTPAETEAIEVVSHTQQIKPSRKGGRQGVDYSLYSVEGWVRDRGGRELGKAEKVKETLIEASRRRNVWIAQMKLVFF